jgi:membrane-associated HD superfamily phosphohydrolase
MMADACEASARALPEPGSERIHALVQKRIKEIFGEGQLDECDLTLRDLDAVASAMARALEVVYRGRGDAGGRGEEDAQGPAARAAAQLHLVPGR